MIKRNDTLYSTVVIIVSVALFYGSFCVKSGLILPESSINYIYIIALAVISTAVAIYTFFEGAKYVGAVKAPCFQPLNL